jgi:hypothetical protein
MMWIEDGSSRRAKNLSGEVSMILRVKFDNEKYDYVNSQFIDDLIEKGQISMFYRPSEKRGFRSLLHRTRATHPVHSEPYAVTGFDALATTFVIRDGRAFQWPAICLGFFIMWRRIG